MPQIKSKDRIFLIIFLLYLCFNGIIFVKNPPIKSQEFKEFSNNIEWDSKKIPKISLNGEDFSRYNLSVIFDETTSSVTGKLGVNYYNNDNISFTRIPFHLFLSGMQYESRMGNIEILNVNSVDFPKTSLSYEVNVAAQLLWVDLDTTLDPNQRTFFEIDFKSIIPDGGFDRANSHGSDGVEKSRIYQFTSFYPMPCVYDKYDGWNIDPYLDSCDPFYHDMAYYNLFIEAPNGMIIAATGELIEETKKSTTVVYHFDAKLPVREVTFATSRYYEIQSTIVNGINISAYYLPKSNDIWENHALESAVNALNLFNETFGPYPYSTFNIVEEYSPYSGMEYPAQVYISEVIDNYDYQINVKKQILEKVIVHEVAHQWWYNLVGFDQIDWGFLDEGLACWSTDYYARILYNNWEYYQWTKYYDSVRIYFAEEQLPSKLNQSTYTIIENNFDFEFISYFKSPLIFEKISRTLGQETFLLGLKTFFEQNQFKIALLSDLQKALEENVNGSLDWLIFPWFDNDYLPKYVISNCDFNRNTYNLTVTIVDQNEPLNEYTYSQQITLKIYDSDGIVVFNELVWVNGTTTFSIPVINKPKKVRLEYENDVIVQLTSTSITYIEKSLEEDFDVIFGYDLNILLFICLLSLIYLIFKMANKQKILFRN